MLNPKQPSTTEIHEYLDAETVCISLQDRSQSLAPGDGKEKANRGNPDFPTSTLQFSMQKVKNQQKNISDEKICRKGRGLKGRETG